MPTSPVSPPACRGRRALVVAWLAICILLLTTKLFTARAGYADDTTVGIVFRARPALSSWEVLPAMGSRTLHAAGENGTLWTDLHAIVTNHVWWIVPAVPLLLWLGRRGLRLALGRPTWLLAAVFLLQAVMVAGLAGRAAQTGRADWDARWLGLLPLAGAILSAVAMRRRIRPRALPIGVFAFSLAAAGFLALAHQRGWVLPYEIWVRRL